MALLRRNNTPPLSITHPELCKEWNYGKNGDLTPEMVTAGSGQKVWWICPLGHSYDMTISNRTCGNGCPYCSVPAKRVLKGFNDLATKYPELAKEWHPTKNGDLTPDSVLCGTDRIVWWKGSCGHDFEQKINVRVKGAKCPYCSHQRLLVGFNDFATEHPELLAEWDYDKNDKLPTEIMSHTRYKAYWICPFGHSYQSWMTNRCGSSHTGCTVCDKARHTSFPEQALFYYIKKYYPDAINSNMDMIGMELDIVIPSLRIAIEYDGSRWHRNTERELKKNQLCNANNVLLIRIREEGLELYDDCYCIVRQNVRDDDSLSAVIKSVLFAIDKIIATDVDVKRDAMLIYSEYIVMKKNNSLAKLYPELAKEWHPTKNGKLTPEMISPGTQKIVWWICAYGHEYSTKVWNRVRYNCGCTVCAGKRIVSGVNDLLSSYPEAVDIWDYDKNNMRNISPNNVAPHSDKKVWWKCNICGYEYERKVDVITRCLRTGKSNGCPKCADVSRLKTRSRKVLCIETNYVYENAKMAAMAVNVSAGAIRHACLRGSVSGGYHWKYVNKE